MGKCCATRGTYATAVIAQSAALCAQLVLGLGMSPIESLKARRNQRQF